MRYYQEQERDSYNTDMTDDKNILLHVAWIHSLQHAIHYDTYCWA